MPCCVAQDGDSEAENTLEVAEEAPCKKPRVRRRLPENVSYHGSIHSQWYAVYVLRLQKALYKAAKRANAGSITEEYLGPAPPPCADAFFTSIESWFGIESTDDFDEKRPLITTIMEITDIEHIV